MNMKQYPGAKRKELSFPLGGIGTGCIGLDGCGRLIDWEIFNRPQKKSVNGYTHFAVKAGGKLRVLNGDTLSCRMGDNYIPVLRARRNPEDGWRGNYGFGVQRELMTGMPHFKENTFEAAFPFAKLGFAEDDYPVEVTLEAFNPFIPNDEDASSLPCAMFTVTLKNKRNEETDASVYFTVSNPQPKNQVNTAFSENGISGIVLGDTGTADTEESFGSLCMATDAENTALQQYWYRGQWFDGLEVYWQDLSGDALKNRTYDKPGTEDTATLCVSGRLPAGGEKKVRIVLSWYYPNYYPYWHPVADDEKVPKFWKNWYAKLFDSAKSAAEYALKKWDGLESRTRKFADILYASSLPEAALDAVTANLSLLKSPTCMRLENGEFYGFEGCGMNNGSCEGSCTHVWNYAFALPFLFPKLERSMRELDYKYNQKPDGGMNFRLMLPLGRKQWGFRSCVDGLMGGVIKFWRDWRISGDEEFLRRNWPMVKRSLEFAWSSGNRDKWDPEKSGVITGRQHHTLDMELFGANAWLNTFYLAALKAAADIAGHLGDASAEEYEQIYRKGRAYTEKELFNGEYFAQKLDLKDRSVLEGFEDGNTLIGGGVLDTYWNSEAGEIKYQIGEGCGIDQVLAQWMSDMSGLGEILDRDKVNSALNAIYKYNFKKSMREHANPCRVYCLEDEAGTVICEWPKHVKKPVVPVPYSEETMHGFEYQAASHLISRGFEEQGLEMVKAVRDRYDGSTRNPWNEMECGSNYARSMASYALLLTYSGLKFDLPNRTVGFIPLKGEGSFFWSVEGAWGSAEVTKDKVVISVTEGSLSVDKVICPFGEKKLSGTAAIKANEVLTIQREEL